MKRIMIVGGTSSIAVHCARIWASEHAADFVLVGRDSLRLERVAADLRVRSPESLVGVIGCDFRNPVGIDGVVQSVFASGKVDIALIAHGHLPEQRECEKDLETCAEELWANGVSPVLFAEALAGHMQKEDSGTIAIIGSVAGDRGRRSNYVYGAAKGLVSRYAQGLQHRLAGTAVRVVLVKPGPTDTPMTAHLKIQGAKLTSPELVAKDIVTGISRGKRVVYTPNIWAPIMMVIRHLPWFVFRKLDI